MKNRATERQAAGARRWRLGDSAIGQLGTTGQGLGAAESTSRFVNWAIEDERKAAGDEARRAGAHRRWGEGGGEPGQRLSSEPFLEILPIQLNIA